MYLGTYLVGSRYNHDAGSVALHTTNDSLPLFIPPFSILAALMEPYSPKWFAYRRHELIPGLPTYGDVLSPTKFAVIATCMSDGRTTANKSLIQALLGTFLLVQQCNQETWHVIDLQSSCPSQVLPIFAKSLRDPLLARTREACDTGWAVKCSSICPP